VRGGPNEQNQSLVVYVTPVSADLKAVTDACARRLPQYMAPAAVVCLQEWPRLANGKVDRSQLRAPAASDFVLSAAHEDQHEAPRTITERAVASSWAGFLGIPLDTIGRHDSLISLGGSSLSAVQFIAQINTHAISSSADTASLPGVTLTDIFRHPSVQSVASMLEARNVVMPQTDATLHPPSAPIARATRGQSYIAAA